MADTPYRAAPDSTGPTLLAGMLMSVMYVFMLPVLGLELAEKIGVVLVILPPLIAFIPCTLFCLRRSRRRHASLVTWLTAAGFQPSMKPTPEEKAALWSQIGHLAEPLDLRGGEAKIRWLARRENPRSPTHPLWIFEFEYTSGGGRNAQAHYRTVIAWPASLPDPAKSRLGHQPGFLMIRQTAWQLRRLQKVQGASPLVSLPTLADISKLWTLTGDADTAQTFLTPAVQAELRRSPNGETWSLGGGYVCSVARSILNGRNIVLFYDRAQGLLK